RGWCWQGRTGGLDARCATARTSEAWIAHSNLSVPDASGVQQASLRDGDDALHPPARTEGHRARHVDDSTRVVHDEAERGVGDAADYVARVRQAASVRAGRPGRRLPRRVPGARIDAGGDHRIRGGLTAAELRRAGRV